MIVLQTLGNHISTQQRGIFQYHRNAEGVHFDCSVGQSQAGNFMLTHNEWQAILDAIKSATNSTFRLTPSKSSSAPNQDLYTILQSAVPQPVAGRWNDSWKAYVCAVLQHEGSLEFYHGTLGRGTDPAPLIFCRS